MNSSFVDLDSYRVLASRIKWLETSKIPQLLEEAEASWIAAKQRSQAAELKLQSLKSDVEIEFSSSQAAMKSWCCGLSHAAASSSSERHLDSLKAQYYQSIKESKMAEAALARAAAHRDSLQLQSEELKHARLTEDKILSQVFGDAQKSQLLHGVSPPETPTPGITPLRVSPLSCSALGPPIGPRDVEIQGMQPQAPSSSSMGVWDRQGQSLAQALANEEARLTSLQQESDRAALAVTMLASAMAKVNMAKMRLSEACEKSSHGAGLPGSVGEWLLRQGSPALPGSSRRKRKVSKAQLNAAGGLSLISEAAEASDEEYEEELMDARLDTRSSANGSISSGVKGSSPASGTTPRNTKTLLPSILRRSNTDQVATRESDQNAIMLSSKSTGLMKVLVQPALRSSVDLNKSLHCLSYEQAGFKPRSSIDSPLQRASLTNIFEPTSPRSSIPKTNLVATTSDPSPLAPPAALQAEKESVDCSEDGLAIGQGIELPPQAAEVAKQGAFDAMASYLDYSSAQHLVQAMIEGKSNPDQPQQLLLQLRPSFSKLLAPRPDGKRQQITKMDASLANRYLLAALELAGHIELHAKTLAQKAEAAEGKFEACRVAVTAGKTRLRVHQRDMLIKFALGHDV
jgi:hypothetical protein